MSDYLNVKCPNCGSPAVKYSAEKEALHCEHCDYTRDLPRHSDKIAEQALGEGFDISRYAQGFGNESSVFKCGSCGSEATVTSEQVNVPCPFCGSANYNKSSEAARVIQPAGVLPFTFPKKRALEVFKEWIGSGFWQPNDLKHVQDLDHIRGVYVPFWTFDAYTQSTWTAESGYYYYETETYRDEQGNEQTRQVQHTRWVPSSGYYENFFDDVLVVASHGISQGDIQKIYPYTLNDVVNYDSHYVLGWEAELYQKDVKEGFGVADGLMNSYIYQECAQRVPGDTHRSLHVSTRKEGLTFKHLLLPLWIAAYSYNGKVFQFIVNGQTGKPHGNKPVSAIKITIAVLLAVLAVIAIVLYMQKH